MTKEQVLGTEVIRNRYGDRLGSRDRVRTYRVDVPTRTVSYRQANLVLEQEQLARIVGAADDVAALDAKRAAFVQAGEDARAEARSGRRIARIGLGVGIAGLASKDAQAKANRSLSTGWSEKKATQLVNAHNQRGCSED